MHWCWLDILACVFVMDTALSSSLSQVTVTGMLVLIFLSNISSTGVGKLHPMAVSWYVSKAALNPYTLADFFSMVLIIFMELLALPLLAEFAGWKLCGQLSNHGTGGQTLHHLGWRSFGMPYSLQTVMISWIMQEVLDFLHRSLVHM